MKLTPRQDRKAGKESGATILEFALVGAVFFVILLGIFEAARYLAVRGALIKGAQDGATIAGQLPGMFIAPTDFAQNPSPTVQQCAQFNAYRTARETVIFEALRFPRALGFIADSVVVGAPQGFIPYRYSDAAAVTCPTRLTNANRDALVIRPPRGTPLVAGVHSPAPGDRYFQGQPPFAPVSYPGTGKGGAFGYPSGLSNSYSAVLSSFPICVELQASLRPLFGIFGALRVEGHACSYQEGAGQSTSSVPAVFPTPIPSPTLLPLPTIPPSPSGTPTPTPTLPLFPTPSGSPTPSPSITPTPSPSAIPSASPSPSATPSASPSPTPCSRDCSVSCDYGGTPPCELDIRDCSCKNITG